MIFFLFAIAAVHLLQSICCAVFGAFGAASAAAFDAAAIHLRPFVRIMIHSVISNSISVFFIPEDSFFLSAKPNCLCYSFFFSLSLLFVS